MRIRATVAAVSGALALSALAVPASQAADSGIDKTTAAERFGVSRSAMSTAAAAEELPVVSKVTINGAKGVVVGTTAAKKFNVSLTASHSAGIQDAYIDLWHGKDLDHVDGYLRRTRLPPAAPRSTPPPRTASSPSRPSRAATFT